MLFVRQFRILPLVNVPKVRYFWILMNSFRIYYLFTNFFCLHFSQGPVSSIVHMWPVSQQTWTCQQSAVWETATVPLVCHVKIGNAGLQRRAPVPEKGYGDWLMEVTCADPYISSLVLRGGVLRLSELPHLPYFYPLSSSSLRLLKTLKVLWILQTQKDLLILLKWTIKFREIDWCHIWFHEFFDGERCDSYCWIVGHYFDFCCFILCLPNFLLIAS